MVSCGTPLHVCVEAAEKLEAEGVSCDVIDLRTIVPLDVDTMVSSVAKTGRLLVVDEAFAAFGLGAEIAASVMERAFDALEGPIGRLHTEPSASPFSPTLEAAVYVDVPKVIDAARAVLDGKPRIPRRAQNRIVNRETWIVDRKDGVYDPRSTFHDSRAETMPGVPLIVPNQDLTITEATILRWLAEVGEAITKDQPVVEVETEKTVSQIEAPVGGTLIEILAPAGTVVQLGQQIGTIQPHE
jgi:2-oxoisovalerate dehydrogenase E1 component